MRSGRNIAGALAVHADILAYWEMRSGRNPASEVDDGYSILAY